MTTYYIQQNNEIVLYDTDLKRLQDTLLFTPQYKGLEIQQTEGVIVDGIILTQEEYQAKLLEEAKLLKLEENKQKRDAYLVGGVEYKGVMFDSDTDSKVNIMGALSALPDDAAVGWNSMDNITVTLTKVELSELAQLLIQMTSDVWGEAGLNITYINAINAAQTLQELEEICIEYSGEQK